MGRPRINEGGCDSSMGVFVPILSWNTDDKFHWYDWRYGVLLTRTEGQTKPVDQYRTPNTPVTPSSEETQIT